MDFQEVKKQLKLLQTNSTNDHDDDTSVMVSKSKVFAEQAGLTEDVLSELSIIHVSGTKGKGSVLAFCESILRTHGLKTGFYSSPHMVDVRERIRINGIPLDEDKFVTYFSEVFNKLDASKANFSNTMPAYFRFMTYMAFHVFLKEKVDVVLLEVGIGGVYDCTNIIQNPTVVGITSLGMDHQNFLGDTIDKIAWAKAGICKPNRPAFTVPQPEDALKVILDRANEIGSLIKCVPPIRDNDSNGKPIEVGLAGDHQRINASLAVQLCKTFLEIRRHETFAVVETRGKTSPVQSGPTEKAEETTMQAREIGMSIAEPIVLPDSFIAGLRDSFLAGRSQSIRNDRVTYYIDGAHTIRSMEACRKWFLEMSGREAYRVNGNVARILIFNSTGDRDALGFLKILRECHFDGVVFCPNVISTDHDPAELCFKFHPEDSCLDRYHQLKQEFEALDVEARPDQKVNSNDPASVPLKPGHVQPVTGTVIRTECVVVPYITDALRWAACGKDTKLTSPRIEDPTPPDSAMSAEHIEVLVTGSMYLVGGVIQVLQPELI